MLAQVNSLVSSLGISRVMDLSLDFFVVLGLLKLLFTYAMYRGKGKVIALLLSIHITGLLFFVFPYWDVLSNSTKASEIFYVKAALFVAVILAMRMILRRLVTGSFSPNKIRRMTEALLLSTLTVGALFSYASSLFQLHEFYAFSVPLDGLFMTLFVGSQALFWWVAGSLICLYFLSRNE